MDEKRDSVIKQVSELAANAIKEVWVDQLMYPAWANTLADANTVKAIFTFTEEVLRGLNIPIEVLLETAPSELAYYWRNLYNINFYNVPPRHHPDTSRQALDIARAIANGIYSMHQQSRRYRNFLNNGFPSGFPTFPEYVGGSEGKSDHVDWGWIANSCSKNRSVLYQSDMSKLPQRKQSLRSTTHSHSDIEHPSRFT